MIDEQVVISLQNQVRALIGRIAELEDWKAGHEGIQAGVSGSNYPHPYQKVSVVEYGSGIMRIDNTGLQILASSSIPTIAWVIAFSLSPTTSYPNIYISVNAAGGSYQLFIKTDANNYGVLTHGAQEQRWQLIASAVEVALVSLTNEHLQIGTVPLWLTTLASDPSVLRDGYEWYRSDTDKFRGRANAATDNFAMETWVTATGAPPVTLAADADTLLGLTGQQLTLDTQTANLIFAGPGSGAAADPTFRSLVSADLPASVVETTDVPGGELGGTFASPTVDATHSGTSHAGVVATHEAAADPHTGYVREADANWTDLTDGGATTLHSHASSGMHSQGDQSLVIIATGVITITSGYHRIETEGGAATDDLDTINGGTSGDTLVLRISNNAMVVTLQDATGNLLLSAACTLNNVADTITLIKSGTNWLEMSRSNNV